MSFIFKESVNFKEIIPIQASKLKAMQYEEIFGAIRGLVMCSARNVRSS